MVALLLVLAPAIPAQGAVPSLRVTSVVSGLDIPWDLAFAADGAMLFTERPGRLSARVGTSVRRLATLTSGAGFWASGETGLMGLALDPGFSDNRRLYTCQGWTDGSRRDVRVVAWTVDAAYTSATVVDADLVSGMPATSGRHGGCRPRFGADGFLWIGTGDAATGSVPQDLGSLGGKVLRVDPRTGAPAPGNPDLGLGSDRRIYTYGHRNVQGLALHPATGRMYSVEHGPSVDDEVHLLSSGGNSGWDPVPGYNERVPMTDTTKFPAAMTPVWQSGAPTIASSGGTFVTANGWGSLKGTLVVANLNGEHLRFLALNRTGKAVKSETVKVTDRGRLRTPVEGPDGALYVTTANGSGGDHILRVAPRRG